ncbi:MAG: hypothetical protein OEZ59_07275 [Deltaproteobacteria bacterium]|nr:hypothetical protein [Deltaproteobacteria bacterium]
MNCSQAARILYEQARQNRRYPPQAAGLTLEEGYRAQFELVKLFLEGGEKRAGWKIGFTAAAARERFGVQAPAFGYLLESTRRESGCTLSLESLTRPMLESELCLELARPLRGPGVSAPIVRQALGAVYPAFEVIDLIADPAGEPGLTVADNVMHVSWVLGEPVRPCPPALDGLAVRARIARNGRLEAEHRGADVIDDQLELLAWLANAVAEHGAELQAGQLIMTGSYGPPLPVQPGDALETTFAGLQGAVEQSVRIKFQ